MAAWRRRANDTLPELRDDLQRNGVFDTAYALWREALPATVEAHRNHNDDFLRRVYGYASWCWQQGGDLENAVAVSFYEHLLDEPWMRPLVGAWLSDSVIEGVLPLWEYRLSANELGEAKKSLRQGRR